MLLCISVEFLWEYGGFGSLPFGPDTPLLRACNIDRLMFCLGSWPMTRWSNFMRPDDMVQPHKMMHCLLLCEIPNDEREMSNLSKVQWLNVSTISGSYNKVKVRK